MAEENIAPVEQNVDAQMALKNLTQCVEKNAELLKGKDFKEAKTIPDGVDVQELLEFKRSVEQNKLESEGKYTEARQALSSSSRSC